MNYADYSSEEIQNELQSRPLVIPVGAIEQHGPHLPLSVDIDIATKLVDTIASEINGIIAPGITYGARSLPHSGGGPSFPGTVHVRGKVLIDYFTDILNSYIKAGATKVVVINAHYENEPFLFESFEVCREQNVLNNIKIICFSWWSVVKQSFIDELFGENFPGWHAEHASTVETSLMLHIQPEKVRSLRVDNETPPPPGVYHYPVSETLSNRGVLARSSNASSELGAKLYHHICAEIRRLLADF